jgi:putative protease
VYEVESAAGEKGAALLRFGNGALDSARIRAGDLVWRTHDPSVDRAARRFTHAQDPVHRREVFVRVFAAEGEPLATTWTLAEDPNTTVSASSSEVLGSGRTRAIDEEFARAQLGRLGDTPFVLGSLELEVRGRPFAPASLLNRVRRDAVLALESAVNAPRPRRVRPPHDALAALAAKPARDPAGARTVAHLHVLVRTDEQLGAAMQLRPASITLDYLDLEGVRPAVERARSTGIPVRVASPRILKPNEERIEGFLRKLDCAILVRSTGLLRALAGAALPVRDGDFSLNAANGVTAAHVLGLGIRRLAPTHDLNGAQVSELARRVGGERLEVIAYHHLPVFHTEHCVFCRFLSAGTSYKDCGRPCETHRVALRDAFGREHPVLADVGCRNTVFGAEAQEASRHLPEWLGAGVCDVRVEFAHESADQVIEVGEAFTEMLAGRIDARELGRRLRRAAPQGTTEGSLHVPENFATVPALD